MFSTGGWGGLSCCALIGHTHTLGHGDSGSMSTGREPSLGTMKPTVPTTSHGTTFFSFSDFSQHEDQDRVLPGPTTHTSPSVPLGDFFSVQ